MLNDVKYVIECNIHLCTSMCCIVMIDLLHGNDACEKYFYKFVPLLFHILHKYFIL